MTMTLNARAARANKGMLQKEAADRIGIPTSMLSWIENGIVVPNKKIQKKIAKAYGLPPDAIDFFYNYR